MPPVASDEPTIEGRIVRGLTLTRPWPWAFLHAGKRVENRNWAPPGFMLGGWLALHAGLGFDFAALEKFVGGRFGELAERVPTDRNAHPCGVIFALAGLRGHYVLDATEHSADPWAFGPEVWELPGHLFRPLAEPVPCRGFQKLWKLPADVFHQVAAQVADAA